MQANESLLQKSLTDKQRYWSDHVERCEALGETMVAYAGEQSLDLKQFYNWKMRLTQLGILPKAANPVAFKRVSVRPTREFSAGCRIDFPNGTRIVVESDCDPAWLTSVVKAVGQAT